MRDDNCIFCKLANGDIPTNSIYEDEDFNDEDSSEDDLYNDELKKSDIIIDADEEMEGE